MNQPYTYLIGWSTQQKYYYGVRYANDCNPTDLWAKYFTSSPTVKAMRLIYGEPDVRQIRKIFTDKQAARLWETKVLRRMKVIRREEFLNKNDAPAPPINNRIMSDSTKEKISAANKSKPKSEEHKQKIREARAKQINTRKGQTQTEETKQKIREARAKQITTDETKQKMSMQRKLAGGYGPKKHTEETKQKIRNTLMEKFKKGSI
jgi:hypothetical protein